MVPYFYGWSVAQVNASAVFPIDRPSPRVTTKTHGVCRRGATFAPCLLPARSLENSPVGENRPFRVTNFTTRVVPLLGLVSRGVYLAPRAFKRSPLTKFRLGREDGTSATTRPFDRNSNLWLSRRTKKPVRPWGANGS